MLRGQPRQIKIGLLERLASMASGPSCDWGAKKLSFEKFDEERHSNESKETREP